MARYPKEIADFMQEYGVRDNEVWQVPGGKSYAVKHSALERIAAEKRISFKPPQVLEADTSAKVVAMLVTASMGDQEVWSIGEAAPGNNKNAYVWSMAEKRGKDRCILKLLSIHGIIYSAEDLDNQERDDTPRQDAYEAPGEPPPTGEVVPSTRYEKHVTEGLSRVPSGSRPAGWEDAVAIMKDPADYAAIQIALDKPFMKNTISAWSNYWIRTFYDRNVIPKVAEFRGSEIALNLQARIYEKYPLERMPEAAE